MYACLQSHFKDAKEHSLQVLQACWNGELTQVEPQAVVDALQAAMAVKDKDEDTHAAGVKCCNGSSRCSRRPTTACSSSARTSSA